jgi:hypothetical protein
MTNEDKRTRTLDSFWSSSASTSSIQPKKSKFAGVFIQSTKTIKPIRDVDTQKTSIVASTDDEEVEDKLTIKKRRGLKRKAVYVESDSEGEAESSATGTSKGLKKSGRKSKVTSDDEDYEQGAEVAEEEEEFDEEVVEEDEEGDVLMEHGGGASEGETMDEVADE